MPTGFYALHKSAVVFKKVLRAIFAIPPYKKAESLTLSACDIRNQ
ncbi:hypothetical protein P1059_00885 [Pasteurella multocida subsp. gallicida P1059]|nr:hypothetical protein P1059_00885 [Pasteurella multocida subsp. gallicida P1059]